jgi:hypothetical protein
MLDVLLDEAKLSWRSLRRLAITAIIIVSIFCHDGKVHLGVTSSRARGSQLAKQSSKYGQVSFPSGPQFVFFAGLEGTGHHILQGVFRSSPATRVIEALNLTEPLQKLENLLFYTVGVIYEHCDARLTDVYDYGCRARREESREGCLLRNAHDLFSSIRATLVEHGYSQVYVPLNIMKIRASYPDGVGPCRAIKYPSLDRLYQVCDYAGVPCRHVYLLRDPFFIVRSTVQKRPFNTNELEALQLHTTLLNVLFAQMNSHSEKLLGCVELLPTMPPSQTIHQLKLEPTALSSASYATTLTSIGHALLNNTAFSSLHLVPWFGWRQASTKTTTEYIAFEKSLQQSKFHTPSPALHQESVVPPELRMHLSSLLRSHEAVNQLCARNKNQE